MISRSAARRGMTTVARVPVAMFSSDYPFCVAMEDPPQSPIDKLTKAGRVLLIGTFLLFGLGLYLSFVVLQDFPAGGYPLAVFVLPVLVACFLFFLIGARILERCGIRVHAEPRSPGDGSAPEHHGGTEKRGEHGGSE